MKNILIKKITSAFYSFGLSRIEQSIIESKMLIAKTCINQMKMMPPVKSIVDVEFKVFSQFGDDGILQYLIHHLKIPKPSRTFVEFGVENYQESNTRFLIMNDNWRGLIMDGAESNMQFVKNASYYWKHNLTAIAAFIDADNINDLISNAGFNDELGILSVDIDGNDYWVWDKIKVVNPIIVVAEYNGIFGPELPLSVPYDASFRRTRAHASNLYWGCSLAALQHLAVKKGYSFVGCNSAGNNAYFVRNDYLNENIPLVTISDGYVDPTFKESRGSDGELTFLTGLDRLREIRELSMTNVVSGKTASISQLFQV